MTFLRKLAPKLAMAVTLTALSFTAPVSAPQAADKPTPDQVKELTLRAAALVAKDGIDAARTQFHTEGAFKYGETYVNVIDTNGTWLIYPPNPKNEGKSVLNIKDADGKLLVQEIIAAAKDKGEGWVDYRWLNPLTNKIEPKSSYVKMIADKNAVAYVGLYK